jgi:hypothetical protein
MTAAVLLQKQGAAAAAAAAAEGCRGQGHTDPLTDTHCCDRILQCWLQGRMTVCSGGAMREALGDPSSLAPLAFTYQVPGGRCLLGQQELALHQLGWQALGWQACTAPALSIHLGGS